MPDIIIRVAVQPGAADCTIADLVCFAIGGQDGLPKRGDRLRKSAEELSVFFARAQCGGVALDGKKTPQYPKVVLRRGLEILIRHRRIWYLFELS